MTYAVRVLLVYGEEYLDLTGLMAETHDPGGTGQLWTDRVTITRAFFEAHANGGWANFVDALHGTNNVMQVAFSAVPGAFTGLVAQDFIYDVHLEFGTSSGTLAPPARISGRMDGRGPLGGARRMDTADPARRTNSHRLGGGGSYDGDSSILPTE